MKISGANRTLFEAPELKCSRCGKPWAIQVDFGTRILPRIEPYCLCEEPALEGEK